MHLRADRVRGPQKPYKPLMLACVLLLIGKGKIESEDVFLDGALDSVCRQVLELLYPSWPYRFDVRYPFRHLETDGIWTLVPVGGELGSLQLARQIGTKARRLLKHVLCARLPPSVFAQLAASPALRSLILSDLSCRYFPPGAREVLAKLETDAGPVTGRRSRIDVLSERALEELLERDWAASPFGKLGIRLRTDERSGVLGRQVLTRVSTIDLLGYRPAHREWWVIELKRGRPADAVVGQVSRYLGWVERERAQEGDRVVGAIVSHGADDRLRCAVGAHSKKLSLWVWDDKSLVRQIMPFGAEGIA